MPKPKNIDLSHHFLVAMPNLDDPNFKGAVVYVCEHNEEGAMGLIINKPLQINLGNVLRHLDIDISDHSTETHPVLMGGPVGQEHGFIVHNQPAFLSEQAKREIEEEGEEEPELVISSSKDTLNVIAQGKGPSQFIITLGYTGWQPGQLEEEIVDNTWLVVPFSESILFDTPIEARWQLAVALLGVDPNHISGHTGHA